MSLNHKQHAVLVAQCVHCTLVQAMLQARNYLVNEKN